ncbi:hypothetical protein DSCOOX_61850 [Desulfosarcina ovata subsp. ovata]|uniref:PilZ domain-containing protein n=2 Tax=Desulfosarcina ovata TaxID=83564 RepID=A0A5K8AJX0_9BACT|nr:hypothetical protein DSCOOX_61850 [Desulfosarcina ovata subsp. ovata]
MRNFSSDGAYIETDRPFTPGTILIVRMIRYPTMTVDPETDERPRLICLAEVRWIQERMDDGRPCYGMGLRYID